MSEAGTEPTMLDFMERIAVGVEKLGVDQEVEMEYGPPICPHCGRMNPDVTLPSQEGGRGPMGEIIVNCFCTVCGNQLFIVIESYSCHKTRDTVEQEINGKKKAGMLG